MIVKVPNVKVLIIKKLMFRGEMTWDELILELGGINPTVVAYHLKELIKLGIVEVVGNKYRIASGEVVVR